MFDRQGGRKYLNWREREAFFQSVKTESDPANRAFCLTLFYTGCRISEALNVTPGRVDMAENALVFATLKRRSDHYRSVPIPETLARLLARLPDAADSSVRLWPMSRATAYRLVKRHMAAAAMVSAWTSRPTYLIFASVGDGFIRHFWLTRWRSDPFGHNLVALEAIHAASNPRSPGPSPTFSSTLSSHRV
jgi:integrase